MTAPGEGTEMSSHDHGNCELCDQLDAEIKWCMEANRHLSEAAAIVGETNESLRAEIVRLTELVKDADAMIHDRMPIQENGCNAFERDDGRCTVESHWKPSWKAQAASERTARLTAEGALEVEARLRVQLSEDSQRHLDRALAAENTSANGWKEANRLADAYNAMAERVLTAEATLAKVRAALEYYAGGFGVSAEAALAHMAERKQRTALTSPEGGTR